MPRLAVQRRARATRHRAHSLTTCTLNGVSLADDERSVVEYEHQSDGSSSRGVGEAGSWGARLVFKASMWTGRRRQITPQIRSDALLSPHHVSI